MDGQTLAIAVDRVRFYARDAALTLSQCICKPDATLKINGRSYKIEKLLGEGGFSFVYLISDTSSGRRYALKKVLVTSGQEGIKTAMREVEAYRRFKHPNIIKIIDSAVVQDDAGDGKIIYLFLPFFSKGNLQDAIAASAVTGNKMPERRLLELFHGTCLAVRALHHYRLPAVSASYPPTQQGDQEPLITSPVFDGDEELGSMEEGQSVPYAHRDIKPGNIMIDDEGSPILMDFGSTIKARIQVQTRQQALLEQDIASEHSTMSYRAPELFDVKTGRQLDEKVDIWSLGCTLFACAYGHSPFEIDGFSETFVKLVDAMLVVDPDQRPDIDTVLEMTESALR